MQYKRTSVPALLVRRTAHKLRTQVVSCLTDVCFVLGIDETLVTAAFLEIRWQ